MGISYFLSNKKMKTFICLIIIQVFLCDAIMQQNFYKAAVLEHAPKDSGHTIKQNFDANVQEYINYIQQAASQNVQILVFPEDGLTGWTTEPNDLEELSTQVPDPIQKIAPCQSSTNYSRFLVELSCAVQKYRIYAVVNLIEWRYDPYDRKKIYHNTNIAFDKNGVVIARYRKINLFDEPHYVPGPNVVSTFTTDFGVTFGMFVCFDIMFKNPALDVLTDPFVTDIVYSAAWFSELPFFEANSIQHGYAKSNAVNLLAAGMNDPSERNGGSGIYLADGRIAETYISGERRSKLIIEDVPIIRSRKNVTNFCQGSSGSPVQGYHLGIGNHIPDTNLFHTMQTDLTPYTFKSLNLNERIISEEICSADSDFCCDFHITVNKLTTTRPNYVYKLVAYYGVSKVSQAKTIGLRNCGLVACLDESNQSCGGRNMLSPAGVSFESITIKGTFNPKDSHYQPSTLKSDLTPATDYMYCTNTISDTEMEVSMITTKNHDSLLTFGIVGRVFINDDMIPGPINGAKIHIPNIYLVLMISTLLYCRNDLKM